MTTRNTFWFNKESNSYSFISQMTKAEWKETAHLIRRFKLYTSFVEDKAKPWNTHFISYNPVNGLYTRALRKTNYHAFLKSSASLYRIHKERGELEEARKVLEEAREWYKNNNEWWKNKKA